MEFMYIKYKNGIRESIIKKGENILMKDKKIISFENRKRKTSFQSTTRSEIHPYTKNVCMQNKLDQEITDFFFNAVHKNYLSNRK
ncbi:hypothetical protein [Clostridium weizhouense]|uniref:Uncharacterized protein n=1 Tax=Clostridium weizhouense TaxID=2859781 RepID=A0ABS7APL6_9CLOT|nr:hypothetical protein [Clostridium weizhouense]MBW6410600.1 hypothetical protein [Clostridium weizhouense]